MNYEDSLKKEASSLKGVAEVIDTADKVVQNPDDLRRMIGVKAISDVYKTLDKMQLRREYHDSLARNGIDFDFIVKGLKDVVENPESKDGDKVKALQVLIKSVGMEKYEQEGITAGGSWEDALMKRIQSPDPVVQQLPAPKSYEVNTPEMPASMKRQHQEENDAMKGIYDGNKSAGAR